VVKLGAGLDEFLVGNGMTKRDFDFLDENIIL
jgi:hypothetical protein